MSYAGMAANVVGGIMQSIAASQEQKAMGKAFQEELDRQRAFSGQEYNTLLSSLPERGAEGAQREMDAGAAQRMKLYGMGGPLVAGQGGFGGEANAALGLDATARSKVGSVSDWQLNQAINNIRTNQDLHRISDQSAGQAQIFPYRMYNAQHSMDELAFWGQMISSIGGGSQAWGSSFGGGGPPTSNTTAGGAAIPQSFNSGAPQQMSGGWGMSPSTIAQAYPLSYTNMIQQLPAIQ